jgi:pimeloyl-ACP methyl ester carboxylesterase
LVRYDRLGVGMSDRDVRDEDLTLGGDGALLGAVLDELALDEVSLVGGSSGGCAAIALSARFPERSRSGESQHGARALSRVPFRRSALRLPEEIR